MRQFILECALILFASCVVVGSPHAEDIAPALEKIRAAHNLPALAAAVIVDGKIVAVHAVGVRKSGDPTPVTVNDQFHLGSCTKAITGTLAALLVEDGRIRWDATVGGVFPELAGKMLPAFRNVTLEQFLAHRSGMPADTQRTSEQFKREVDANKLPGKLPVKRLKFLETMSKEKLDSIPGSTYQYANCNFTLAAAMLERVTGTSWEELADARIFRPLGMKSAGFGAMGEPGKIKQPWQHYTQNGTVKPVEPGPDSDNPALMSPAGRVHCSLGDWAKFVAEHLRGEKPGGNILRLTPEAWKRIHTPAPGHEYVAGWNVTRRGWAKGPVITHGGTNLMNYAVVWASPDDRFTVLAATNQGGDDAAKACDEVSALMIGIFLKPGK